MPIAKTRPTSNSIAEIRPNFSLICRTQTLWPDGVEFDNHTVERIAHEVNTAGIQTLPPQIILETFPNLWCIPVVYFYAYSKNWLPFITVWTLQKLSQDQIWLTLELDFSIPSLVTWLHCLAFKNMSTFLNSGISQNFISFYFGSTLVLILGGNRLVTEKGSSYWLMNVIVFISLLWLSWWRWYQTNKKCDVGLII